MISKYNLTQRA